MSARTDEFYELIITALDGSDPVDLVPGNPAQDETSPVYLPDGGWIAFRLGKMDSRNQEIVLIHPDGSNLTGTGLWGFDNDPAEFSPDGRFLFGRLQEYGAVAVLDLDDPSRRLITNIDSRYLDVAGSS